METRPDQLEAWLAAPRETENLEFKEAKQQYDTTKLFKYCVALANEGAGISSLV
jgi:ATP-dependent DNA helicase RecG